MLQFARREMCRELCEKRIQYELLFWGRATVSLERCVRMCERMAKA